MTKLCIVRSTADKSPTVYRELVAAAIAVVKRNCIKVSLNSTLCLLGNLEGKGLGIGSLTGLNGCSKNYSESLAALSDNELTIGDGCVIGYAPLNGYACKSSARKNDFLITGNVGINVDLILFHSYLVCIGQIINVGNSYEICNASCGSILGFVCTDSIISLV